MTYNILILANIFSVLHIQLNKKKLTCFQLYMCISWCFIYNKSYQKYDINPFEYVLEIAENRYGFLKLTSVKTMNILPILNMWYWTFYKYEHH